MHTDGENGGPRIYLDHAATSWPKPEEVRREMLRALDELTANAGRSAHAAALASARLVFDARQRLAALLGVEDAANLVFTRGCTEGLNLVLKGLLQPGDRVLVSPLEHNAVMRPLQRLVRERSVAVETLPADPWGRIDWDAARRLAAGPPPALLVAQHASNVNGAVQDLHALREVFPGSPLLVDAAQTAGVLPIDVGRQRIDFLAFSAHKGLLGPTGLGACYLSPKHDLPPLMEGGTGSGSESVEQPAFRPDRYESGTLNLHGIAGLRGALAGLKQRGLLGPHQQELCGTLIAGLAKIPGVRLHSPADGTALCVAFTLADVSPERVAAALERRFGVLCRAGLQCAASAHHHLGTFPVGTVRLSPGWRTTPEMVEVVLRGVSEVVRSGA